MNPTKKKVSRWGNLNGFVDVSLRGLTPAEVRVWLILFRDTKQNGTARTGQTDIATRSGLSVRMVRRAIKKLRDGELVRVVVRGGLNAGPSTYQLRGVNPDWRTSVSPC